MTDIDDLRAMLAEGIDSMSWREDRLAWRNRAKALLERIATPTDDGVLIPKDPVKRAALTEMAGLTAEEKRALDQWVDAMATEDDAKRRRGMDAFGDTVMGSPTPVVAEGHGDSDKEREYKVEPSKWLTEAELRARPLCTLVGCALCRPYRAVLATIEAEREQSS